MRLHPVVLFLLLSLCPAAAQSISSTNASSATLPSSAQPPDPNQLPNPADSDVTNPLAVPGGVNVHWYGHGFVYLISSVGVRAAIDPFGSATVHYKFPPHLAADFVLVSHEAEDHSAAEQLFGNPLIFRSVTAIGLNRANGIPFHGTALQRDPNGHSGANTAFSLTFDGVKFCYLGQIDQPLSSQEKQQLGHADVVFLPVGLTSLSVNDFDQVARDLGALLIIPVNYKTDYSGDLNLRALDDYLQGTKFPIRRVSSSEMAISRATLPTEPTICVLKSP